VNRLKRIFKHLCYSFRPPLFVGFLEGCQVLHAPPPIRDASGHRRCVVLHLPAQNV
jgi:hypothetical protein